jgi:poly(3-hydroxyalkanoate) synthetase
MMLRHYLKSILMMPRVLLSFYVVASSIFKLFVMVLTSTNHTLWLIGWSVIFHILSTETAGFSPYCHIRRFFYSV